MERLQCCAEEKKLGEKARSGPCIVRNDTAALSWLHGQEERGCKAQHEDHEHDGSDSFAAEADLHLQPLLMEQSRIMQEAPHLILP